MDAAIRAGLCGLALVTLTATAATAQTESLGNPAIIEDLRDHDADIKADLEAIRRDGGAQRRDINATLEIIQTDVQECRGSWSQKLAPAAQRFTLVLDDQAVLDRETCLVWQRTPMGPDDWENAHNDCITANTGGRFGWRLPTVEQLSSLIDPTQFDPALPFGHPFRDVTSAPFGLYWTATTLARNPELAWIVQFQLGFPGLNFKVEPSFVWCVRGGQGYDAY